MNEEESVESEPVGWEVKKVVDKRRNPVTGDLEYLLEWKNWSGPPTWEPLINCDCTALIKKYERQQQQLSFKTNRRTSSISRPRGRAKKKTLVLRSSSSSPAVAIAGGSSNYPRAKSPLPQDGSGDTSCSEASSVLSVDHDWDREIRRRKLLLKEIVGAVNGEEILLIVKWHGIANLEKVPLEVLRRFHSQDILDFFLAKISWTNSTCHHQQPS